MHAAEPRVRTSRLKRGFDVVASGLGLIVLAPVFALVALGVRLTMGAPVLFRHPRPGLDARLFTLYKFRTMRAAAHPGEPDAARLTRFGRFLRRTSLDELPELVNVLKGEMSLVGPRPLLIKYLPYYRTHEQIRHRVRPGITGWAQTHGRNLLPWDERLALDVWYVEHWSFGLDLRILAATFVQAFTRHGVLDDPRSHPTLRDLDETRADEFAR